MSMSMEGLRAQGSGLRAQGSGLRQEHTDLSRATVITVTILSLEPEP
jgi:hypothetical protein